MSMRNLLMAGVAALSLTAGSAGAAVPGTAYEATVYQVQVKQVEICTSAACGTSIVLGTGDLTFDIASQAAGQQVGSYAEAEGIPAGMTFTHVRVTIDETITMQGGGNDNSSGNNLTCYTDNTPTQDGDANTVEVSNNGAAPGDTEDFIVPTDGGDFAALTDSDWTSLNIGVRNTNADNVGDVVITYPLTAPYTSNGQEPLVTVEFDTSSALGVYDGGVATCVIFPRPPTVTISISNP